VRVLAGSLVLVAAATIDAGAAVAARLHGQNFFSNCYVSHVSRDDPIVYPNQPGFSHSHTFFGSKSTNASSTAKTLRASPTNCRRKADTAAYWVPTLSADGVPVRPTKGSAYFVLRARGAMHAFPPGLKIVAGDAHASTPQSLAVTYWSCSTLEGTHWTRPHACTTAHKQRSLRFFGPARKSLLQLDVFFPDCWDGKHLDSRDHRSHMAYSRNWTCPRSHPVKVPRLRFIVTYPIQVPKHLELASGGIYSAHADFLNAWHQRALDRLVADCFAYRPACNAPVK
jgi:hypothetical protein